MPLIIKDRVRERSFTTGTGALTLAGPAPGFQSFAAIGDGNTTYYTAVEPNTGQWETGVGTYNEAAATLTRDTVLESSNAGEHVVFFSGAKDVFCTYPASRATLRDEDGNVTGDLTGNAAGTEAALAGGLGSAGVGYTPAGAGAVVTDVQTVLRDVIRLRDFPGVDPTGAILSTAGIALALAESQASGRKIVGRAGDIYAIDADFIIAGSPIKIDLAGCVVRQTVNGRGFLQLREDGNSVRNVHVEYLPSRVAISGSNRFRGFSAWQRMTAVWCESSNNGLYNITSKNMNGTLCLRGPVVRNPAGAGYTGADTDPSTAYFYNTLAADNRVDEIHGTDQDFVITGHQQTGMDLGAYSGKRITMVQNEPPHVIYMRNPDELTNSGSIFIRTGHCIDNLYGTAHKFLNFAKVNIGILSAVGSSGGVLFQNCSDVFVDSASSVSSAIRLGSAGAPVVGPRYGIYSVDSKVRIAMVHADGVAGLELGGVLATGASSVDIDSIKLTSRNPVGVNTAGVVRAENTSVVTVGSVVHEVLGEDTKESLVATGDAVIQCGSVKTTGTTKIAVAAGGSSIVVSYDPQKIAGFSLPSAFTGNVKTSRITPYREFQHGSSIALYGATSAGAHAYTNRGCYVIRKNDEVTVYVKFTVSGAFGGTGDVRIGPLPYAINASTTLPDISVVIGNAANITVAAGEVLLATAAAADSSAETFVRLQTMSGISKANLPSTALGSSARLEFALTYRTTEAI